MQSVILSDLRANVDPSTRSGMRFWLWVLGKAAFAPQVHAVLLYRLSAWMYLTPLRPLSFLVRSMAMVWAGADIHPAASFGPGFVLVHSQGVCIGSGVRAGRNCRLHQGVTLGEPGIGPRGNTDGYPIIGANVVLGAHAVVLGSIRIGDGAVVGANSVVTKDVPANMAVAGSPARVLRELAPDDNWQ